MISRTRIRSFIAAVVTIAIVLVFGAFVSSSQGWNLPIFSSIADMLGMGG